MTDEIWLPIPIAPEKRIADAAAAGKSAAEILAALFKQSKDGRS